MAQLNFGEPERVEPDRYILIARERIERDLSSSFSSAQRQFGDKLQVYRERSQKVRAVLQQIYAALSTEYRMKSALDILLTPKPEWIDDNLGIKFYHRPSKDLLEKIKKYSSILINLGNGWDIPGTFKLKPEAREKVTKPTDFSLVIDRVLDQVRFSPHLQVPMLQMKTSLADYLGIQYTDSDIIKDKAPRLAPQLI